LNGAVKSIFGLPPICREWPVNEKESRLMRDLLRALSALFVGSASFLFGG
jgi:hypothetical protein